MNTLKVKLMEMLAKIAKPDLTEVSTWQGICKLVASAGLLTLSPDMQVHAIAVCVAVAGLIDYVRKEKK